MGASEKKILENRAHNLARILKTDFADNVDVMSAKIDCKPGTIKKFLNVGGDRPCGANTARRIELLLDLDTYSLDRPPHYRKNIYYVAIYTNTHYAHEIVKALKTDKHIQECSAVMGDFDILVKAEVENIKFLDLLLAKIARLPGVKRSQTYPSISELQWQRAQAKRMTLPDRNEKLYFSNGMEEFIHHKMLHHFNEIKALEKGEVTVRDEESLMLEHYQIIKGTRNTIMATKNLGEVILDLDKYIKVEQELIEQGVKSRRIIFLSENYKNEWGMAKDVYQQYKNIGCRVAFVFKNDWIPSPLSKFWEAFIIIDEDSVCVRRDEQGRILIKRTREMIQEYTNTFEANWRKSLSFNFIKNLLE